MHGVAWFEATLVQLKYLGISNSDTVVSNWMPRDNATVPEIITRFMGRWIRQASVKNNENDV